MILLTIFTISVLLALGAVISATETAITASSPGIIHKMKAEGNKSADLLLSILKKKDKVISTLLIGYSIISTLSTTMATALFVEILGSEVGTVVSSMVMTFLIIVFAEVIPKAIAVVKCHKIALKASRPLKVFLQILEPVNIMLSYIVRIFCAIFRIDLAHNVSAEDEVRGVIDHHMHEGNVVKHDRDMLGGILNLRSMEISEIMTHRSKITAIDIKAPIENIIATVFDSPHSRFPCWENTADNIIGILHVKDLLKKIHAITAASGKINAINIRQLLIQPVFVPENSLVVQQLHMFQAGQTHLACVVNEYGDLKGIVTLEDILEEIVGQIYDEHDLNKNKVTKLSNNSFLIDGSAAVRDLNREFNWLIPEQDAITLSGFIISKLQKIPSQGDYIITGRLKLIVQKISQNRISFVKVILSDLE
jgi:Mg2+/Co2+ transporter CorB